MELIKNLLLILTIGVLSSCFGQKPANISDKIAMSEPVVDQNNNVTLDGANIQKDQAMIEDEFNTTPKHYGDRYWDMADLSYFLKDKSIKSLGTYAGTFSDLTPLAELPYLEELEIDGNDHITDISPLSKLKELRKLTISSCKNIISIQPLSNLYNLQYLYIFNAYMNNTSLSEISMLKNLLEFKMNTGNIVTLNYIAELTGLRKLDLDISCVKDNSVVKLRNLKELTDLQLFGAHYTDYIEDETPLSELNLNWIKSCTNLENLELRYFKIHDLSPLAALPKLQFVALEQSLFDDLMPLLESNSIKTIGYYGPGYVYRETIQLFAQKGIDVVDMKPDH